ncbi:endonuclease/exonuclease/phosphatase family protein [Demequina gelatinilytica]|uniref:endonuclease/exonuclease/phosphatase family protein n=1 Tax=Demequina gelatinilytica TaxID=1638980 RepID=UPI0007866D32|nr:endonuclease/exonuclease/phosphatase family protein [Demequina gelatinilytica]
MGEPGEGTRAEGASSPREAAVRVLAFAARAVAWTVLVVVLVPVLARLTGFEAGPLAVAVSMVPWATLAAVIPVALAAAARAWNLLAAAAAVLVLGIVWIAPLYVAETATGEPVLRIGTLSLGSGAASSDAIVAMVREQDLDVLALTEVVPETEQRLADAGLDLLLPHHVAFPEYEKHGTGLWSRLPLSDGTSLDGMAAHLVRAQVETAEGPLTVIVAHPESPNPLEHGQWESDLEVLHTVLETQDGPVVVAGDLNATRDHRAFRAIEELGYADAVEQAGAGFIPTFPRGMFSWRLRLVRSVIDSPLVAIDHVLVRDAGLVATHVDGVEVPWTDHRGLVVEYSRG